MKLDNQHANPNFFARNHASEAKRVSTKKFRMSLRNLSGIVLLICIIAFSSWLMFHTFSYDANKHEIQIAFKLWSDFGAHIPLIRSFSMGDNLNRFFHGAVEYPIFPGEPIRYHYLFYMFVGILEKIGLRIDWALNVPSIIGFSLLMGTIYYLSWLLTRSRATGILSLIFFIFNGSFGFIRFFTLHPLSSNTLTDIIRARDFPAFAPWGPGLVTAFWNLNIYTNQRHLALAFAVILLFIITMILIERLEPKRQIPYAILWSGILGVFPYFHQPALLVVAVLMIVYFFVLPKNRIFLLITGFLSAACILPQLISVRGAGNPIEWYPGYTVHNELLAIKSVSNQILFFLSYWVQNLGLHSVLFPIGFFFLPKKARLMLLPIIPLFIIPNLVKFSVEASANHKFFNFVMIPGSIISANIIILLLKQCSYVTIKQLRTPLQIVSGLILIGGLTLTGIIDFFVVVNDVKGTVSDIPKNEIATWIQKNTPTNAVFLNSSYLYHPASLAGRAIFLGWPYFAWSAGYKENRMTIMNALYEGTNTTERCALLSKYHISHITVEHVKNDPNLPTIDLSYYLNTYRPLYRSSDERYAIFSVATICPKP